MECIKSGRLMTKNFLHMLMVTALFSSASACGSGEIETTEKAVKAEQTADITHPYADMEIAAQNGNVMAQFNMGVLYDEGTEVEEDDEKAVAWYKMAAEQNFAPAQMSLGEMYDKGLGVEKDFDAALKYYQSAALQGNVEAQLTLGLIYQSKTKGLYNQEISANWFRVAAQQGHALGMTRLGAKYADGRGVEKDLVKGYMWSHLGTKYGNKEAQLNIEKISSKLENTDIIAAKDLAEACLNSAFKDCE